MKRFYKSVDIGDGNRIRLDGRAVKTPGKADLALPMRALAEAIAQEWAGQGEEIVPATMPLTKLANTAVDRVPGQRDAVIDQLLGYARHDHLAYRAEHPAELVRRQSAAWDPLLEWAGAQFGARLVVTQGISHIVQPEDAIEALRRALETQSDFAFPPLQVAASITGSLILALALAHGRLDAREAFTLSQLDEAFQAEKWGQDHEAQLRNGRLLAELESTERFLRLL